MKAEHSYERCLKINKLQDIPCYMTQLLLRNTTVYNNNNICQSHHIADIVVQNYSHNKDQQFEAPLPHPVV